MSKPPFRRLALLALLAALVAIQFVPTGLDRAPADPALSLERRLEPSPEIASILQRSCNDCHGTPRSWPWYASVAPVSWLIARDVKEAKEHADFSLWGRMDAGRQAKVLDEIREEAQRGSMPPGNYLRVHRDARLSPGEVQLIGAWTERERARLSAAPDAGGAEAGATGR